MESVSRSSFTGVKAGSTGGGSGHACNQRESGAGAVSKVLGFETFPSQETLREKKMADSDEQHVSSTTLLSDELHHYQAEPNLDPDRPEADLFRPDEDDIVDLVGGAKDALERHKAEDSATHELTETSSLEDPEAVSEPEAKNPEPKMENAIPDSTNSALVPEIHLITEEPEEAESCEPVREPQAVREPDPAPESDALPAADSRKAAEQPAVTEERPAPASCEYLTGKHDQNNPVACSSAPEPVQPIEPVWVFSRNHI